MNQLGWTQVRNDQIPKDIYAKASATADAACTHNGFMDGSITKIEFWKRIDGTIRYRAEEFTPESNLVAERTDVHNFRHNPNGPDEKI